MLSYFRNQSTTSTRLNVDENIKPFDQLPQPDQSLFSQILFLMRDYKLLTEQNHICASPIFKRLGPIFKTTNGGLTLVMTADPKAAESMFRAEGKYPRRMDVYPWLYYRSECNLPLGILLGVFHSNDEDWKETRSAVDKRMLKLKDVQGYSKIMNKVIDDSISYLLQLRGKDGVENEINGFESQTFR
ncbi:Cytochrome P450 11B2, mitochondrial [Trichoplax sp. H2]|nr:Cytochrome P450 11B2, mitochondrial [Trichoplax sp. H2]|eukprot:RDD37940.1 Cytochrome P450 11B2, mitochondrial [Trichoplax sp. H2]